MKLLFPEYRKGQLCSYTGSEYDIDTDDYITEITDVQSFKEIADVLETHAEINELIEQVIFSCENAKVFKYYSLKKTEMQNRFILLTKDSLFIFCLKNIEVTNAYCPADGALSPNTLKYLNIVLFTLNNVL